MMVDFALEAERRGDKRPEQAIFEACLLRFRPIMMTTMAAILGALPLVLRGRRRRAAPAARHRDRRRLDPEPAADLVHDAGGLSVSRPLPAVVEAPDAAPAVAGVMRKIAFLFAFLAGCAAGRTTCVRKSKRRRNSRRCRAGGRRAARCAATRLVVDHVRRPRARCAHGARRPVEPDPARRGGALPAITRTRRSGARCAVPGTVREWVGHAQQVALATNQPSFAVGAVNNYNVALNTSWELDVWGRVRRSVEAGEASWQASAADLEAVRLSAYAALAQSYFALRVADAARQVLEDTVAAYERTLELTRNRYAAGVAARVDVVQAECSGRARGRSSSTSASSARSSSTRSRCSSARRRRRFQSSARPLRPACRQSRSACPPSCSSAGRTSPPPSATPLPPMRASASRRLRSFLPSRSPAQRDSAAPIRPTCSLRRAALVTRWRARPGGVRRRAARGTEAAGDRGVRRGCGDVPPDRAYRLPGGRGQLGGAAHPGGRSAPAGRVVQQRVMRWS